MDQKIKNSLDILNRIVFRGDENIFRNDFYQDEELLNNGYNFVSEIKSDIYFEAYVKFPKNNAQEVDIIDYENYIKLRIRKVFDEIQVELGLQKSLDAVLFKNLLFNLFDELTSIFKKAIRDPESLIIKEILTLSDKSRFKYSHIIESHRFYDLRIPNTNLTQGFFQPKEELKMSFFNELYFAFIDYRIIDSEISSPENFTDLLISPNPMNQIQFNVNNYIAVYILDKLSEFFYDLNAYSINKSKLFLNKRGKPLLTTDLNTARTRGKEKEYIIKGQIDEVFDKLKKEYLK